tara:strand:- start:2 stop:718 length:717 start_codon:yes stop_codon:yes gene_type:complete
MQFSVKLEDWIYDFTSEDKKTSSWKGLKDKVKSGVDQYAISWDNLSVEILKLWEDVGKLTIEESGYNIIMSSVGMEKWTSIFDENEGEIYEVFKTYLPVYKSGIIQFSPYAMDDWDVERIARDSSKILCDALQNIISNKNYNVVIDDPNTVRLKKNAQKVKAYKEKLKKQKLQKKEDDINSMFRNLDAADSFREYIYDEYLSEEAIMHLMRDKDIRRHEAEEIAKQNAYDYMESLGLI